MAVVVKFLILFFLSSAILLLVRRIVLSNVNSREWTDGTFEGYAFLIFLLLVLFLLILIFS